MRPAFMYGGTQKAASSWLHAAIRTSRVDASSVKEWHYWDRLIVTPSGAGMVSRSRGGPLTPTEFAEALEARGIAGDVSLASLPARPLHEVWPGERRDLPRSAGAPDLIRPRTALAQWVALMRRWQVGDFTPANSLLSPSQWSEICSAMPSLHVITAVRNPTTRFWSVIRMCQRRGVISRPPDPDEAVRIARAPGFAERSRISRTLIALRARLPADQVLVITFDEVRSDPRRALDRLGRFLGAELTDPGATNVGLPGAMPEDVRERLEDHFRDEVDLLADLIGEAVIV